MKKIGVIIPAAVAVLIVVFAFGKINSDKYLVPADKYYAAGNYEAAIKDYSAYLHIYPISVDVRYQLACSLLKAGRLPEARSEFLNAMHRESGSRTPDPTFIAKCRTQITLIDQRLALQTPQKR